MILCKIVFRSALFAYCCFGIRVKRSALNEVATFRISLVSLMVRDKEVC